MRVRAEQQAADGAEDLVPHAVPARHVQVAEAVDVDDRDREGPPVALRALEVELELGAKDGQGDEARNQRVARGQACDFGLELGNARLRRGKLRRTFVPAAGKHLTHEIGRHACTLERPFRELFVKARRRTG